MELVASAPAWQVQRRRFSWPVFVHGKTAHVVAERPVGHGDFAFLLQMPMNLGMFPIFMKKFVDYLQASHKLNSRHVVGKGLLLR